MEDSEDFLHKDTVKKLDHSHAFGVASKGNERRTLRVIVLTTVTMCVEIGAGIVTGSMALLADGWHMGTHAFALGITYFAYVMARRHADSSRYSFGTGKFGVLAGYTSALFLGAAGLAMIYESISRMIKPVEIAFNEAIIVSVVGLTINLLSIWLLGGHDHHHEHDHHHDHGPHGHDHNMRAAYLHVIADAMTSVLAIVALVAGKFLGWAFLDPVMGIVGGLLISKWAYGLLKSSGLILLDGHLDSSISSQVEEAIHSDNDSRIADLHVWPVSSNEFALVVSVVSGQGRRPEEYKERLVAIPSIKHVTIETHSCTMPECDCKET